ncbi:hypothetical protein G7066_12275 [Leucobacter coleopterorum]|uniref:DUF2746 domain-containing protein n=1 Tax=Leucobacter coleopterorum TaxID=2714933 RepID=A0ABX6JXX3_9MICO|nr:hypothetical protein [Leucobacter coleopterorum]QIM19151.1 hypothetical protein G7066_12275 [Leucobacter coleopterorum]
MVAMNEPQVWTLIGVFAAVMTGLISIITRSFTRSIADLSEKVDVKLESLGNQVESKFDILSERIDGLKTEMMLRFEKVDMRFEQVDQRFEQIELRIGKVEGRLDKIEKRVDDIDHDVQLISKNTFPQ